MDKVKIKKAVKDIIEAIGEDPEREGLKNTPGRVADMYEDIFSGIKKSVTKSLKLSMEDEDYEDLVLVKDIRFYSMCEHHFIPFFGEAHVAYIPRKGKVVGFSKIVKVIETLAKRPQLQERMTGLAADSLMEALEPNGVLVLIKAEQMCMTMRGVKKEGSKTITSAARGLFKSDTSLRNEAINLFNQEV